MKWPRARITTRWMMIAVMIAAIGCAVASDIRRKSGLHRLAEYHSKWLNPDILCDNGWLFVPGEGPVSSARVLHHRALHDKYERAARDPWLPVAPDPPEPE